MRRFWTHLGFALLVSCVLLWPDLARSQTIKTDATRPDTVLHIVRAGGTTFDSARVERRYNGATLVRWVRANATDTARFARITSPTARTDSVVLLYTPLPRAKRSARAVRAFVVAPPVVTGPVVTPAPSPVSYRVPTLPTQFTPTVPVATRRVDVPASANLQAALNAARPGDELVLPNGTTFTGNFTLPVHAAGWVTVRGETCPASRADSLIGSATVTTPNSAAAFITASGARGWELKCFRATAANSALNYGIVVLGSGASTENTLAHLPSDIVLDRLFISGSTTAGTSRCVAFNGIRLALTNSFLAECHAKGSDAQGVGGWNGSGPFLIANNRIEASGQGIMFGGADPWITGLTPADITITGNHLFKPLAWGTSRQWTIKAAFELKHARRVLFERNVIENHWADAQTGFAVLLENVSQNQRAERWSTIRDVTIRDNVIRNSTSGFNIQAKYYATMDSAAARVLVADNLWENVCRDPITGSGTSTGAQFLGGIEDVTFTRNTFTCAGSGQKAVGFDGTPSGINTTISDNVFAASSYGVAGSGTGAGTPTLDRYMLGGVFRNNVVPGARAASFPLSAITLNATGADVLRIRQLTAGVVR